ncbi:hypothetical protein NST54_15360 [Caldifermentibacillus hisashii]|uniref:hypothetical protein n=1 Tax=Caldifermentibacillus hisashii TaxID=996558 RepID=UPI0034D7A90C
MKKILISFLLLTVIIFTGITMLNLYTGASPSDGLEINNTYIGDSKELVSKMQISGSIREKQTIEIKTLLNKDNRILITRSQEDSELRMIVRDKRDEKVLEKQLNKNQIDSFKSSSGEGTIQFALNEGDHEIKININEDE